VASLLGFEEIVFTAFARFCLSRSDAKAVLARSFAAFKLATRAWSGVLGGLGTFATLGGFGARMDMASSMMSSLISLARIKVFMRFSNFQIFLLTLTQFPYHSEVSKSGSLLF
jgi:hypothetical protein